MASRLNPYISFKGNAREAMEYYKAVFGGELTISTFGSFPGADPATADQVMHAQLETKNGYTLMASDTAPGMETTVGDHITISLSGEDEDDLRSYWEKLSDGGTVRMPLEKQMWGDIFGQCVDRFGVAWMIDIVQPQG
jgi:PhnB protein